VPIKNYEGVSVAALSVTGPVCRMTPEKIEKEVLPVIKKYAREISKRIGISGVGDWLSR